MINNCLLLFRKANCLNNGGRCCLGKATATKESATIMKTVVNATISPRILRAVAPIVRALPATARSPVIVIVVVVIVVVIVVIVVIVVVVISLEDFFFFFGLLFFAAFAPLVVVVVIAGAELAITFVVIALLHAFKEAILLASVAEVGFHPVKHVVVVIVVVIVVVVIVVVIVVIVVVVSLHRLQNVVIGIDNSHQQQSSTNDESLHLSKLLLRRHFKVPKWRKVEGE